MGYCGIHSWRHQLDECPSCAAIETLKIVKQFYVTPRTVKIAGMEKYPLCEKLGLSFARTEWHGSYGWQHVIDAAAVEALLSKASEVDFTMGWTGRFEVLGHGITESKIVRKCLMIPIETDTDQNVKRR